MVIDAHTHIFPPEVISDRERFFEGEPNFQLLYGSPKSRMAGVRDLIDSMDENKIDCSVVFGFPWNSEKHTIRHNEYVLESAARYPHRLIPLACLDLFSENCISQARDMLQRGAAGFGELAIYSAAGQLGFALENFEKLGGLCRERNCALLVHANEPLGHMYPGKAPFGLEFYYSMARSAAGVGFIMAHWGGGILFYELLKKEAPETLSNVYYDTAASPYLYKSGIYPAALGIVGENRIIFGSDYPLLSPKRYFDEMKASGLTESQIRAISGDNAARLFRLQS